MFDTITRMYSPEISECSILLYRGASIIKWAKQVKSSQNHIKG